MIGRHHSQSTEKTVNRRVLTHSVVDTVDFFSSEKHIHLEHYVVSKFTNKKKGREVIWCSRKNHLLHLFVNTLKKPFHTSNKCNNAPIRDQDPFRITGCPTCVHYRTDIRLAYFGKIILLILSLYRKNWKQEFWLVQIKARTRLFCQVYARKEISDFNREK